MREEIRQEIQEDLRKNPRDFWEGRWNLKALNFLKFLEIFLLIFGKSVEAKIRKTERREFTKKSLPAILERVGEIREMGDGKGTEIRNVEKATF